MLHTEREKCRKCLKGKEEDAPFMLFSASVLQRCRQPLTKCSSSSLTLPGAGCWGQSAGGLHWVKGLWMGVLCVELCVQPEPSDEPASSASVWLTKVTVHTVLSFSYNFMVFFPQSNVLSHLKKHVKLHFTMLCLEIAHELNMWICSQIQTWGEKIMRER